MKDILGQINVVAFFAVMAITPLAILLLGVLNYVRDPPRRATIAVQALAALFIWIVLTITVVMIFFMTVFEYPAYRSHADEVKSTAIFVGGTLIYFLVAGLLIFWTKRQTKRMPAMGISC